MKNRNITLDRNHADAKYAAILAVMTVLTANMAINASAVGPVKAIKGNITEINAVETVCVKAAPAGEYRVHGKTYVVKAMPDAGTRHGNLLDVRDKYMR